MKSVFSFCLIFLVLLCKPLCAEPIELKMGYFTAAPHLFQSEDLKHQGALIDFFEQQILQDSNYKVRWYGPYTHARLAKMLESGELDGMALLVKTETRKQFLHYVHAPFYKPNSVMVFLKEHPLNIIKSADDLIGQRIGFLLGIKGTPFLANNVDKLTMDSISGKDWIKRNLLRLVGKRIEAAFCPEMAPIRYEIAKMDISDKIKILPVPEPPIELYFVFSKKSPHGRPLVQLYNERTQDITDSQDKYLELMDSYY